MDNEKGEEREREKIHWQTTHKSLLNCHTTHMKCPYIYIFHEFIIFVHHIIFIKIIINFKELKLHYSLLN
jgi:hypothetical protein